ncbi:MAG TPA: hypothetical protein VFE47_26150 [Tepidisphaeraceae bacterium]|jgi:hypothetical protein|nr:hypothetical protein [Tepidisphaeraceae bacterium]
MASQRDPKQPSNHVAIFPPPTHAACKVENWSQTPIKTADPAEIIEGHIDRVLEEQEAERWDGMS